MAYTQIQYSLLDHYTSIIEQKIKNLSNYLAQNYEYYEKLEELRYVIRNCYLQRMHRFLIITADRYHHNQTDLLPCPEGRLQDRLSPLREAHPDFQA